MFKTELIKEIASRANFTIGDVKIIWDTFEDIVKDLILEKSKELKENEELDIITIFEMTRLFNMHLKKIRTHRHYIGLLKRYEMTPEFYRISIKPSHSLVKLAKGQPIEDDDQE